MAKFPPKVQMRIAMFQWLRVLCEINLQTYITSEIIICSLEITIFTSVQFIERSVWRADCGVADQTDRLDGQEAP